MSSPQVTVNVSDMEAGTSGITIGPSSTQFHNCGMMILIPFLVTIRKFPRLPLHSIQRSTIKWWQRRTYDEGAIQSPQWKLGYSTWVFQNFVKHWIFLRVCQSINWDIHQGACQKSSILNQSHGKIKKKIVCEATKKVEKQVNDVTEFMLDFFRSSDKNIEAANKVITSLGMTLQTKKDALSKVLTDI